MNCCDRISFPGNCQEDFVGNLDNLEFFYLEYKYEVVAWDNGRERIEFDRMLKVVLCIVLQLVCLSGAFHCLQKWKKDASFNQIE